MTMVLDVIEVAKSHSGLNLATAFAEMIHNLKLETKVRLLCSDRNHNRLTRLDRCSP